MVFLKKLVGYLDFTKPFRKGEKEPDKALRFMHGTNRLSIFMFIICLIIMLFKLVIFAD